MKKILLLFILVSTVTIGQAQKISKKVDPNAPPKLEYLDIQQILENADALNLTAKQIRLFEIKKELVNLDLYRLNGKTTMEKVERDMHMRNLKDSYQQFIERTLNEAQENQWIVVKTELQLLGVEELTLKQSLRNLDKNYKKEIASIKYKYQHNDKRIYYAQRNVAKKNYETKRAKIYAYYENQDTEQEIEKVMTLEEIADLYKQYDDFYNQEEKANNPLDYLDFKEELDPYEASEQPYETTVEEEIYEEGDY